MTAAVVGAIAMAALSVLSSPVAGQASATIEAVPESDGIFLAGWSGDSQVALQILAGPAGRVLFSGSVITDADGNVGVEPGLHGVDIEGGQEIVATAGATTRRLVVAAGLSVRTFDYRNDVLTGTMAAGTTPPAVFVFGDVAECSLTPEVSGSRWTASFAGPPCTRDLTAQTDAQATVFDDDGDQTTSYWARPTCDGEPATVFGTPAGERLVGTAGNDVIAGLAGADTIIGRGGSDLICAGGGHDEVNGGPGGDTIFGQAGRDDIDGKGGSDTIFGGGGNDELEGNAGRDRISGQGGSDTIGGGGGNDRLLGGPKPDVIAGNAGDDVLIGGGGDDTCRGGPGNDTLRRC